MLSIFICEDDLAQRQKMEKIVRDYVMIEDLGLEVALITHNPQDVLDYLEDNPKTTGLYFLDVDLGHEMTGIGLAAKVRALDDLGKIVFVTTHGELSYLTFMYKVEALDYIIKDSPEGIRQRVYDCIKVAHERYLNDKNPEKKIYKVKVEDRVLAIDHDDIMFIESSDVPHMLILHLDNSQIEYYGSLREVEEAMPTFYRCHKSYVVNPRNIKEIYKSTNEVEMLNEEICLVSVRKMKGLVSLLD